MAFATDIESSDKRKNNKILYPHTRIGLIIVFVSELLQGVGLDVVILLLKLEDDSYIILCLLFLLIVEMFGLIYATKDLDMFRNAAIVTGAQAVLYAIIFIVYTFINTDFLESMDVLIRLFYMIALLYLYRPIYEMCKKREKTIAFIKISRDTAILTIMVELFMGLWQHTFLTMLYNMQVVAVLIFALIFVCRMIVLVFALIVIYKGIRECTNKG